MLCPKCGNEIPSAAKFCTKCGCKLDNETNSNINAARKRFNKKYLFYALGAAAFCAAVITAVLILSNPISRFKRAVNSTNYAEAAKIYDKSIRGSKNKETEILAFLKSDIKDIKKQFTENKIQYDTAISKLDTIDKLSLISSDIYSMKSEINTLNDSRTSFKKANEFLNKKEYLDAFTELKKVIKEDENYAKAQELLSNSTKDYKAAILTESDADAKKEDYSSAVALLSDALTYLPNDSDISSKKAAFEKISEEKKAAELKKKMDDAKSGQELTVEKAAIVVQSSEYKALYPDMIQAFVHNNTNKTVKNMVVSCLGFDSNGYPLKVKSQFSFDGGSFEFSGNAENINLVPNATFGENVGWNLDENHGIKTVLACVKEVEYYDGSKWNNPYYDYWIQEYKEKQLH